MKILVFLVSLTVVSVSSSSYPTVKINDGVINGVYLTSYKNKDFNAFLGIPYAEPPVGKLRFKNPVPTKPNKGTFEAKDDSKVCIQRNDFALRSEIYGEEDCLYLNVYTPKNPKSKKLPVMVYIHGGGWLMGSGNRAFHGPEYFMKHDDIILVTLNYRLGPLGFLSTEDDASPGNYGLKDQQVALKWVNKNIKYFGGDRDSVTLFGESAGAASTHYHMFSKGSRGLFHRAILQSGSAFMQPAHYYKGDAREIAFEFAKEMNCSTESSVELVECLSKKDAREMIDKSNFKYMIIFMPMMPFRAVVEVESKGAFLTKEPIRLYEDGEVPDIPVMIGLVKDEGAILSVAALENPDEVKYLNENIEEVFPHLFLYDHTSRKTQELTKLVHKHCFDNQKVDMSQIQQFTECDGDMLLSLGTDFSIRMHLAYLTQPVYYYNFAYKGDLGLSMLMSKHPEIDYGVCHSDELLYLFKHNTRLWRGKELGDKDSKMVELMTKMWTDFAKTSVPLEKSIWAPTSLPHIEYLEINGPDELKMSGPDNVFSKRLEFWYSEPFNTKIHSKAYELTKLSPVGDKLKKNKKISQRDEFNPKSSLTYSMGNLWTPSRTKMLPKLSTNSTECFSSV